jgi:endogenous inhibitor of DNA gyrase (YacG/DUF329 family)
VAKVELVCDYCGKKFLRYPSNAGKSKNVFCSRECHEAYIKVEKEVRVCKQCGKEFEVYKSALEKSNASGNFCGRECYNKYQETLVGEKSVSYKRMRVNCPNCGKELYVVPSRIRKYKNTFCSIKCRSEYMKEYVGGEKNANWKGGASRYRGDFEDVKKRHFYGIQHCAICGTSKKINIHHIIPYRLTHDNSVENLIPLCRRHHKIVESASLKFIELFGDEDYSVAEKYMNIILRSRQLETYTLLRDMINRRSHGA